ncbi:MAG: A/G-specific adenine glycosylase [Pseudomonadota bacterium]
MTQSDSFSSRLLNWFDQFGRKDLPWQQDITPYRVWVSEIMLQQTQVKTATPYYLRFMASFPDVTTLAQADIDTVLHHWSGLGYYTRARNLHTTAQIVVTQHSGQFPETIDGLIELPGIGRSTAGAIAAIAMGQHSTILDGNVKRVLCRYHAIEGWQGTAAALKTLWGIAEQHTPVERTADYTQAIMDLGATVCTRSKPKCSNCPMQSNCKALASDTVSALPTPKPKKIKPSKPCQMLIIHHSGQVLLIKRPNQGIWGGLWGFPQRDSDNSLMSSAELADWATHEFTLPTSSIDLLGHFKHTFSHYHLLIDAYVIELTKPPHRAQQPSDRLWYALNHPQQIGTAAVVGKLLDTFTQQSHTA